MTRRLCSPVPPESFGISYRSESTSRWHPSALSAVRVVDADAGCLLATAELGGDGRVGLVIEDSRPAPVRKRHVDARPPPASPATSGPGGLSGSSSDGVSASRSTGSSSDSRVRHPTRSAFDRVPFRLHRPPQPTNLTQRGAHTALGVHGAPRCSRRPRPTPRARGNAKLGPRAAGLLTTTRSTRQVRRAVDSAALATRSAASTSSGSRSGSASSVRMSTS